MQVAQPLRCGKSAVSSARTAQRNVVAWLYHKALSLQLNQQLFFKFPRSFAPHLPKFAFSFQVLPFRHVLNII